MVASMSGSTRSGPLHSDLCKSADRKGDDSVAADSGLALSVGRERQVVYDLIWDKSRV